MKKLCFLFCCCCCFGILLLIVGAVLSVLYVMQKGMEPPPGYVASTVPMEQVELSERLADVQFNPETEEASVSLTRQELRSWIGSAFSQGLNQMPEKDQALGLRDLQVEYGEPSKLPTQAIPRAYPLPVGDSVQLDFIAAVDFDLQKNNDPWTFYLSASLLAGPSDCKLYYTPVDIGFGSMTSLLELVQQAENVGKPFFFSTDVQYKEYPGLCLEKVETVEESLVLTFTQKPETQAEKGELPAEEPEATPSLGN